jgi:hypothetical protein
MGLKSYIRTPEIREKERLSHLGRKHNYAAGGSLPGVAEKIRQSWTPEMRQAARERGIANAADPEWRKKIGESVSGEKSGTWEDGRAQIPYSPGWGHVNRRIVWEEQDGRCQMCGELKPLDTHHKDGSKSNHARDNLVGLCRKCHKYAHKKLREKHTNPQD